ncbi:MAG: MG2 domain-containing protein, partial [Planctomycetota bacterium]
GHSNYRQNRLDQIVKNWGEFDPVMAQPAGKAATVDFRFRNGSKVSFEAREVRVQKLLDDVKAYLKSNPGSLDWEKMNIQDIGWRLVAQGQEQYLGDRVASWDLGLKPRPNHFDRRITVETPLKKAGAYLLTAQMADGNTTRILVWLDDLILVKTNLDQGLHYFAADAVTGKPVAGATLDFFGWRQEYIEQGPRFRILTSEFRKTADADGQAVLANGEAPDRNQWLVTAKDGERRFAHLGFSHVWYGRRNDEEYNQVKVFLVTDRPVYRPKQVVKFKIWMNRAQYDQEGKSAFAGKSFTVEIRNPKGDKVLERAFPADEYGGFDGELALENEATLGVYQVHVRNHGGGSFRVEEYKKPEFEVKVDAPAEPVALGEKIKAKVTAKYYFGAPVTNAKVKTKVLRSTHSANWYPLARWDWFYEPGYWWYAYDYAWYPGWAAWGCRRPIAWWWPRPYAPPELVSENEVPIGRNGTVEIEIDTAPAKAAHGDSDHRYEITVEVVDESRRTIAGTGQVIAARKPFKVYAWVDRGHYRAGDTVEASFQALTVDSKPVQGKGALRLLNLSYDKDGKPSEAEAQSWALDTDVEGKSRVQIKASAPGQYRLSYKVTDGKKREIEGGYVFCVGGEAADGSKYRFNDIELVNDKREYKDGEKVLLKINTEREDSTVVFFARPSNGVYLPPKILRLKGKSAIEELAVTKKDMPNFFVEAYTISGGRVHRETREIVVPPETRALDVSVLPSSEKYKPGETAKVKVKVTDSAGKPFRGSTVISVYDKAVEYISGGSNVPEIKAFFWKWRRHHYPQGETTAARMSGALHKGGEIAMAFLGAFGHLARGEQDAISNVPLGGAGVFDTMGIGGGGSGVRSRRVGGEHKDGLGFAENARAPGAPAPPKSARVLEKPGEEAPDNAAGAAQPPAVEPTVRSAFADTAFWAAALATDEGGNAEVEFKMPENLTTWKVRAWTLGAGTRVGEGTAEVLTTKNLLLRLQAPRFFVEKDEVVLSANVHNYLKTAKDVKVVLELDGKCIEAPKDLESKVRIEPSAEKRVDWRVKIVKEGEATIRMKALTDEESDAMEMKFPVYVHGMMKTDSFSGVIRPDKAAASITLSVPNERRVNESRLEIRYSPTLAGAMVDALPYMAEYPYGCTEQTLSRFLPTVITQKILLDMGLDLKDIQEKRTNLNAQEIGDDLKRMKDWQRLTGTFRWNGTSWVDRNPVFDLDEVQRMAKEGIRRLQVMQNSDGGWGWFSGWGEQSYPHTTAYVVHGLQIARANGVALPGGMLDRGIAWMKAYQDKELRRLKSKDKEYADNLDAFVYMVLADEKIQNKEMMDFLYRDRTRLAVYGKAMFGLALERQGEKEKLAMIARNIEQFLVQDDENQTAYLRLPEDNYWWYWYGSENEAQAYYLKLLAKIDPKGEKASRLVKYILNNRRHATYWNSTRDTAICIEAMADYLKASGEDKPEMTLEILVDGKKRKEVTIDATNLFTFDNKLVMVGDAIEGGKHTVEIRRKGKGPVYFNAYLGVFTLEDDIKRAGLEVKVNRKYYKLVREEKSEAVAGTRGEVVSQRSEKYARQELSNLASLKSGDLVEIELEIDSKNDYEYLVFEDMKPAGFEPVEVKSGYNGNDMGAYVEFRDERVVFFARALARDKHSVSYRMRAETPGRFSALPTRASAMYAPELKANSDEIKLIVSD